MATVSQTSDCVIDHIVLLVSTEDLDNLPAWLSDDFNILDGGVHSGIVYYTTSFFPTPLETNLLRSLTCEPAHLQYLGQSSRNKLIVFADGTYLELFNWFDTPPDANDTDQPMRVWGRKRPGLIDFALSSVPPTTPESHFEGRVALLEAEGGDGGLGVGYTPPEAGGRTRKDGVEVKWKVSRPEFSKSINTPAEVLFPNGRIDAPFFCYDVTSRDVRVPFEDEAKTTHACGAVGVAGVEILVPKAKIDAYAKLYSSILGSSPETVEARNGEKEIVFHIELPVKRAGQASITIRSERTDEDLAWLKERGIGISGLVLATGKSNERVKGRLGPTGIASTISLQ